MELKTITVHSFKGGTGKSFIATNLAVLYALQGLDTCLIDMDFRAPSLHVAFQPDGVKYWFNDYLDGKCRPEDVLIDVSGKVGSKARLQVAFANPSPTAIKEMMAKSIGWEREALRRLLDFTRWADKAGFQRCIIDTSPGYLYSSVNALVASDVAMLVVTTDDSDLEGAKQMLAELYKLLDRKIAVVLNKVVGLEEMTIEAIKVKISEEIAGAVRCSCEVAAQPRRLIYVVEKPDHPITEDLRKVLEKVDELEASS